MRLLRRRFALFGAVALAAAGAGFWLGGRLSSTRALDGVRFPDLGGKVRDLAEWRGKVLVVNFWATWCAPCREEIPMLMQVRDRYAGQGLEIVGIAIDNAAKVSEFAADLKINYPILVSDGTGLDLIRKLGNTAGGLPYTVFLDRDGRTARTKLGILTKDELEAIVSDLIK